MELKIVDVAERKDLAGSNFDHSLPDPPHTVE